MAGPPAGGSVPRLLLRVGSTAALANVGVLVANTLTGVFTARLLGPEGRGVLTAVILLPQTAAILGAVGAQRAVSYHRARNPDDGGALVATWLALAAVLFAVTFAVAFALLPVLLAAQPDRALELARLYLLTMATTFVFEVAYGSLLGQHRFGRYNTFLLVQPTLLVVGYTVLWQAGTFTVERVLLLSAAVPAVLALVALADATRTEGLHRPSLRLARTTLAFGVRTHGTTISGLLNARLDLLIIPAFLAAESVGFYAVATNVSVALAGIAGSLAQFVLPLAAKEADRARHIVVGALWLSMGVAATGALVLALVAGPAIELVYGAEFASSVPLARILLVGVVVSVGSVVLFGGLEARGRPLAASAANGLGALVAIVGLLLFLRDGGTTAAATVTSTASCVAFVAALTLYRRSTGMALRELVPRPSLLAALLRRRERATDRGPQP